MKILLIIPLLEAHYSLSYASHRAHELSSLDVGICQALRYSLSHVEWLQPGFHPPYHVGHFAVPELQVSPRIPQGARRLDCLYMLHDPLTHHIQQFGCMYWTLRGPYITVKHKRLSRELIYSEASSKSAGLTLPNHFSLPSTQIFMPGPSQAHHFSASISPFASSSVWCQNPYYSSRTLGTLK